MKTFADMLAAARGVLTSAAVTGSDPRSVDIQLNTPVVDAEGVAGDGWATIAAAVPCVFLEKDEGKPQTIEAFGRLTGKVTRAVSFGARHDLTTRHRLVYVDSGGTTHRYPVLATQNTGELDVEWVTYVYEAS